MLKIRQSSLDRLSRMSSPQFQCLFCYSYFLKFNKLVKHTKFYHSCFSSLKSYEVKLQNNLRKFERIMEILDDDNWGERWKIQREKELEQDIQLLLKKKTEHVSKKVYQHTLIGSGGHKNLTEDFSLFSSVKIERCHIRVNFAQYLSLVVITFKDTKKCFIEIV